VLDCGFESGHGKLAWHFQPSPHDVHDWDAVETPVLLDAEFKGKPRKLLAQASRNGFTFLLDRTNDSIWRGQHLSIKRGPPDLTRWTADSRAGFSTQS